MLMVFRNEESLKLFDEKLIKNTKILLIIVNICSGRKCEFVLISCYLFIETEYLNDLITCCCLIALSSLFLYSVP